MSLLNELQVATPCSMKWKQMSGDDRVRRCERCRLHVYNLSAMTEREALRLVKQRDGNLCAKFLRREDGTVLTQDCRGGFSEAFWEKFGAVERTGMIMLVAGAFTALFFAAAITIFGDDIRMLLGQGTMGAIDGTAPVAKRPPRNGTIIPAPPSVFGE